MSRSPKFIGLLLRSIDQDYVAGGIKRLVPYILTVCFVIGFTIAFNIPDSTTPDTVVKFLAALITAQGIILAMTMQTAGTILTNISQGEFSAYLKSQGLIGYYMVLVQWIQYIHLFSLLMLIGSLVAWLFDGQFTHAVFNTVFAIALSLFMYALSWSWRMTTAIKDLIYHRSEFQYDQSIKKVITTGSKQHRE